MVDLTSPYTINHSPAKNSIDIAVNSNILIHVLDDLSGVNMSSIVMKVKGNVVAPTITGSPSDYTLSYDPPSDFGYDELVTVSVDAIDEVGNTMSTDSYSFKTLTLIIAPTITHSIVSTSDYGQAIDVQAGITDDGTVKSVTLYYRSGGETTYIPLVMTELWSNFYQGTIPETAVTERGIEYFIQAIDNQNAIKTEPASSPELNPHVIQVYTNNLICPNTTPTKSYRMFAVPLLLDNGRPESVLADDLGAYERTEWRLFRLQNEQYIEYTAGTLEDFFPGRGFWLITKDAKQIDAGPGYSVKTSSNYIIQLKSGWNMIGNPFSFPVNWDQVVLHGNVEAPVTYTGTGNNTQGFVYNQSQLVPWQGYAVKNLAQGTTEIEIPPIAAPNGLAKSSSPFYKREFRADEWLLQLSAHCDNFIDQDNFLGCLKNAEEEWDKNDFSEVPPFENYISLYFPHLDWKTYPDNYTADFRSEKNAGMFWHFTVSANIYNIPITLKHEELMNLPSHWEITLIDTNIQQAIEFKNQSVYTYSSNFNEFMIIV